MANIDLLNEPENETREQLGGGRFSRLLGISFVVIAMVGGAALAILSGALRPRSNGGYRQGDRGPQRGGAG